MRYKVLTLTQPWATLVAIGAKKIETRSWATSYRGELLIHAAKGYPDRGIRHEPLFMEALWKAGIKPDMPLPTAAIVGVCTVVECVPTRPDWAKADPHWFDLEHAGESWSVIPAEPEYSFGNYDPDRYAILLSGNRELPTPIPARGALGLWTWEGSLGV